MEKVLFFCVFSSWIMQIISSDVSEHEVTLLRVQLNKSISLNCNMTDRYEIAWFHQHSQQITQIISAETSEVSGKRLLVMYNKNWSHLKVDVDKEVTRVSLVITGLTESDSGLYFCGTKSVTSEMHFEKPFRLEIEGILTDREEKRDSVTEPTNVQITDDGVTPTERMLMFGGVGLAVFVFFLTTVIAGGIIYHRGWQKGWKEAKCTLMSQKSAK